MARFQDLDESDLINLSSSVNSSREFVNENLSIGERLAIIKEFKGNLDLLVRKAGKGGVVILLKASLHRELNLDRLSDNAIYCPLTGDPTTSFNKGCMIYCFWVFVWGL
ncbi:hypothetical protein GDO78_011615 [Eleutherodactylus coqui]|uniref:Uncharacterized protein n=1 Tax=Eleutherodactylus coqui TaxID=57060 RepID=A0A8J6F244_ELECQ|nr:hypothetical protein GDO78_011615 [Eleutherodactylus coqui]